MTCALDQHVATLAKLTRNAVITLSSQVGGEFFPRFSSPAYTGLGKWTTIAAIGVFNNMRKAGCIEDDGHDQRLSALGIEVATAIAGNVRGALGMCRQPRD